MFNAHNESFRQVKYSNLLWDIKVHETAVEFHVKAGKLAIRLFERGRKDGEIRLCVAENHFA